MVLWSLVWTTIDFSGSFLGWSGESLLMAREKQRISVLAYWKALATPQTALPAADSKLHIVAGRSPTLLFKCQVITTCSMRLQQLPLASVWTLPLPRSMKRWRSFAASSVAFSSKERAPG